MYNLRFTKLLAGCLVFITSAVFARHGSQNKGSRYSSCNQLRSVIKAVADKGCGFREIFALIDTSENKGAFLIDGIDTVWNGTMGYAALSVTNRLVDRAFYVEFTPLVISVAAADQYRREAFNLPGTEELKSCLGVKRFVRPKMIQPLESTYSYCMVNAGKAKAKVMLQTTNSSLHNSVISITIQSSN